RLQGGALGVGARADARPAGLAARVRGLQVHGRPEPAVAPGSRCAVNLQGVELAQLARGQVLCAPGALAPTRTVDVRLEWLDVAPPSARPVSVQLPAGTAPRRARAAPPARPPPAPRTPAVPP